MIPTTETPKGGLTECGAPAEIKTRPETHAALRPDSAASHTRCCHHTHAAVTTPNGLLLRALVCCGIHALNRHFKTHFRNTCPWLHIFMCSRCPLSLEKQFLSGIAPRDPGSPWSPTPVTNTQWPSEDGYRREPGSYETTRTGQHVSFTSILDTAVAANPSSNSIPVLCPCL